MIAIQGLFNVENFYPVSKNISSLVVSYLSPKVDLKVAAISGIRG